MASYCIRSVTKMGELTRYDIILEDDSGYQEEQSYAFEGDPGATGNHTAKIEEVVRHFQTSRNALVVVDPMKEAFDPYAGVDINIFHQVD